ncbi:glycoside hydrolase family 5 protein [Patulibacter defluvii]|uniref:glycoside hydrolase family 5 protein n=1 Tax=Patulibacter defluvii TaxID=3095358 RepID=UPI002A75987E|nr:cellulase family glycosylhydrolase [Patulibacter sp. DM4]
MASRMDALWALILFLLSLFGLISPPPPTTPPPVTPPQAVRPLTEADRLQVAEQPSGDRALRTADGRRVLLRGTNVNTLVDHGGARDTVPVTAADGPQARALGFNVVRLAVSWSKVAPQPGQLDQAYLDEIRDTARVFTAQGIYVLLDMHQDRYAAGLGRSGDESDGAPAWAALTDGASTAAGSGNHPYYGTAAARQAAKSFFENREVAGQPLQDHYADAVRAVAATGRQLGPAFAGIELWNEPVDPWSTDAYAPDTFSAERVWPLYRRLIGALRGDGYAGPIWFEPHTTRTWTDDDRVAARFSDDDQLVYGPHVYTDVYGGIGSGTAAKIRVSFDNAAAEARRYGAALVPTELPGVSGGNWETYRQEQLGHLDRLGIGGIVWVWKQTAASDYGWGVLKADGSLRDDSQIARDYGRPRVLAHGPELLEQRWANGVLTVRTRGAGDLDLWDGAAFAANEPATGVAGRLTVDDQAPDGATVTVWRGAARLGGSGWGGGRQLRLRLPAGDHVVRLQP